MATEYTACFTGHRPEKLVSYGTDRLDAVSSVKKQLYQMIVQAVEQGYTHFYSGMARGVDLYAAQTVLYLKRQYPRLTLTGVIPFSGHHQDWSIAWQQCFQVVLAQCAQVEILSSQYFPGCYQQRNEYMVDRSGLVIAVWNGRRSGTANTLQYARLTGKEIRCTRIDPAGGCPGRR